MISFCALSVFNNEFPSHRIALCVYVMGFKEFQTGYNRLDIIGFKELQSGYNSFDVIGFREFRLVITDLM